MPPPPRRPRLGSHSQSSPNLPTLNTTQPLRTVAAPFPSPLAKQQNTSTRETFPELNSYSTYGQDEGEHTSTVDTTQSGRNGVAFAQHDSNSDDSESEEDEDDDNDRTPEARASPRHSYLTSKTAASLPASSTTSPLSPTTASSLGPHSAGASNKTARPAPIRAQSLFDRGAQRSQSSSNLTSAFHHHHHPNPAAFAPPFYNRPPTPLPPSPSLTSLLRPSFSAAPGRAASTTHSGTPSIAAPTPTDSSSDTDATAARATLAAGPASASTTSLGGLSRAALAAPSSDSVRRAAPAVPTYEYYGFVLHLGSSAFFGAYVLWASLPTPLLAALGVTYYPSRWWSLAVPCWIVAAIVWLYVALASYNTTVLTERAAGLGCLVDAAGQVAVVDAQGRIVRRERRRVLRGGGGERGSREQNGPRRSRETNGLRGSKETNGLRASTETNKRSKDASRSRSSEPEGHARRHGRQARQASATSLSGGEALGPGRELAWRTLWNEGTDAVLDVPIGGVCEVLYGDARDGEEDEDGGGFGLDIDTG